MLFLESVVCHGAATRSREVDLSRAKWANLFLKIFLKYEVSKVTVWEKSFSPEQDNQPEKHK